ncbi:MAG: bifunctional hydroxymethylpyrimidine kinase/phosphomethylpyrimidine kinase [Bacteroidales bacterium]
MEKIKSVLTIAGSDSIGGAGIQADIKTIFSLGLYAASCITAVTAQNTIGVKSIQAVNSEILTDQIDSVLNDISVNSIKIGMIYTKKNISAIKNAIIKHNYTNPIVLDPVLVATSGDKLTKKGFLDTLKKELFPICDILTPNITEAEIITNTTINNLEDMISCGKEIIAKYGVRNVIIKGGHSKNENMTDVLIKEDYSYRCFAAKKIDSKNTHGTGCTLSSAIASYLAMGMDLEDSILHAKEYVFKAILSAKEITIFKGHGSTNHFHSLQILK